MSVSLTFEGLEALKAELRKLPDDLTTEAGGIVGTAADAAAADVIAAYPSKTGNLKAHVKVQTLAAARGGVIRVVKSTASHAHLYEFGHMTRINRKHPGTRHHVAGKNVLIPIAERRRARMSEDLTGMLERSRLHVHR